VKDERRFSRREVWVAVGWTLTTCLVLIAVLIQHYAGDIGGVLVLFAALGVGALVNHWT
jgi:hypothetical protein